MAGWAFVAAGDRGVFVCPDVLNGVGGSCLVKRRGVMRARVAFGRRRVLIVGRVQVNVKWKRRGDGLGGEENCLLSRLRLREYPSPPLEMNLGRGFGPGIGTPIPNPLAASRTHP